jgi:hypothetical protein
MICLMVIMADADLHGSIEFWPDWLWSKGYLQGGHPFLALHPQNLRVLYQQAQPVLLALIVRAQVDLHQQPRGH